MGSRPGRPRTVAAQWALNVAIDALRWGRGRETADGFTFRSRAIVYLGSPNDL